MALEPADVKMAGGVTTVRDMGNDNKALEELRTDIESGSVVGPRIVPAGFIEGESRFASRSGIVIKSVDEGKLAIDWYRQRGRRQIKLYNSIHPDWVEPLAAYAHAQGMRVSGQSRRSCAPRTLFARGMTRFSTSTR